MPSGPMLIAEGIAVPEGPVWCDDGSLVVTSVGEGALYRIWPAERRKQKIADTAGGANGAAPASDGGFVVTQNGGFDLGFMAAALENSGLPAELLRVAKSMPSPRLVEPGLQRVAPDGTVAWLARGLQAPNDLVVAADGTIYFTDPPRLSPAELATGGPGKVRALRPDGRLELVADGFSYCNGIGLEPDGGLAVVEGAGLMRLHPGGEKEWICEQVGESPSVDGFCVDRDGRFYMAASHYNGVRVVEDGKVADFLPLPGGGVTTNCCFGGADGRTLFATNGLPGTVWMWEDMPTAGLPLHRWPAG